MKRTRERGREGGGGVTGVVGEHGVLGVCSLLFKT